MKSTENHFGGSRSHQSEKKRSRIRYLMKFEGSEGLREKMQNFVLVGVE